MIHCQRCVAYGRVKFLNVGNVKYIEKISIFLVLEAYTTIVLAIRIVLKLYQDVITLYIVKEATIQSYRIQYNGN